MLPYCRFYPTSKYNLFWLLSYIYFCYCICYFSYYCTSHSLTQVVHVCVCMCVCACIFFHPAFWIFISLCLSVVLPFPCWGSWFGYIAVCLLIPLSTGTGEFQFGDVMNKVAMDILKFIFKFSLFKNFF